ncbi:MAG: flavin reductase family protein [Beijerinckiaceae bacterium]
MNAPTPAPFAPAPSAIAFREAMSRVAGAVHVIATNGSGGLSGATVTAVTSVTDNPPSLLVCLNQKSHTLAAIRANGAFSVQALSASQIGIARIFAGEGGVEGPARFRNEHGWLDIAAERQPLLPGALAIFRCRLAQLTPVGTHMIVIGAVEEALTSEAGNPQALVYLRRGYQEI